MRLQSSNRHRRRLFINITSLIDVLFLLLIFFMVSSTFVEAPGIKLDLPRTGKVPSFQVEQLVVEIDAARNTFVSGLPVPLDSLLKALRERAAGVDEAALQLKSDKNVPHGLVVRVMDIARQAGIRKLIIATKMETNP
jgi:biopolymer transport protein ExbD